MDYTTKEGADAIVKHLKAKFSDENAHFEAMDPDAEFAPYEGDAAYFYRYQVKGDVLPWFEGVVTRDLAISPEKKLCVFIKPLRASLNGQVALLGKLLVEKKKDAKRKEKPVGRKTKEGDE